MINVKLPPVKIMKNMMAPLVLHVKAPKLSPTIKVHVDARVEKTSLIQQLAVVTAQQAGMETSVTHSAKMATSKIRKNVEPVTLKKD
jgi:hypothetical protein